MNAPIVYVSTWKVRPGRMADYRSFHDRLAEIVRTNEPRTAAFLSYANDEGTEITGIHVFADADALEQHMGVLGRQVAISADDMSRVSELLAPGHIEVYGERSSGAAAMDTALADVAFELKTTFVGGFVRTMGTD